MARKIHLNDPSSPVIREGITDHLGFTKLEEMSMHIAAAYIPSMILDTMSTYNAYAKNSIRMAKALIAELNKEA